MPRVPLYIRRATYEYEGTTTILSTSPRHESAGTLALVAHTRAQPSSSVADGSPHTLSP